METFEGEGPVFRIGHKNYGPSGGDGGEDDGEEAAGRVLGAKMKREKTVGESVTEK